MGLELPEPDPNLVAAIIYHPEDDIDTLLAELGEWWREVSTRQAARAVRALEIAAAELSAQMTASGRPS